jgi:serine/tyrosine/threonine adenylyltransferase
MNAAYRPETIHAALGEGFFDPVAAADFPQTILRYRNRRAASNVGLETLSDADWIAHFGRFRPLPGSFPEPLALRYHGHQFQVYNPELGDGRGFLFAQLRDDAGRLLDLGTKGSGQTPYSRTADGRLTLKGGVREVLATAMLEAQGVVTSSSFSLIETGEKLMRGDEPSPTRSAVLVRLSHSHIRFGTFQRLLFENDAERIDRLVRHSLRHYLGGVADDAPTGEAALTFFQRVVANGARMVAQWMAAGFVHGVMNTDNMNITGESFDYGPYRWLPAFEPGFTAAYFDQFGLYAYGRQPGVMKWNLARLAECLTLVAPLAGLEAAIDAYDDAFAAQLRRAVVWRLGLAEGDAAEDDAIVSALFAFLRETKLWPEQVFFALAGGEARSGNAGLAELGEVRAGTAFARLQAVIAVRPVRAGIDLSHPYFAAERPCSMQYDAIETLWMPIAERDDWSAFEAKLAEIEAMRLAYGR